MPLFRNFSLGEAHEKAQSLIWESLVHEHLSGNRIEAKVSLETTSDGYPPPFSASQGNRNGGYGKFFLSPTKPDTDRVGIVLGWKDHPSPPCSMSLNVLRAWEIPVVGILDQVLVGGWFGFSGFF